MGDLIPIYCCNEPDAHNFIINSPLEKLNLFQNTLGIYRVCVIIEEREKDISCQDREP